jgi:hypothetical protein
VALVYNVKGETGGGGKINDKFRPYGFVPSRDGGEGEALDGDHLLERQLGGPDEISNLWPLDRSENRSSGSLVKSIEVKVDGAPTNVHQARADLNREIYLLVVKVRGG